MPVVPASPTPERTAGHPGFARRIIEGALGNAVFWVIGAVVVLALGYCGLRDNKATKTYGIGDSQRMGSFLVTVTGPLDCSPPPTTTRLTTTTTAPPTTKSCKLPIRARNRSDQSRTHAPRDNYFVVGSQRYAAEYSSGWLFDVFPNSAQEDAIEVVLPIGIDPDKVTLDGKTWSLIE